VKTSDKSGSSQITELFTITGLKKTDTVISLKRQRNKAVKIFKECSADVRKAKNGGILL